MFNAWMIIIHIINVCLLSSNVVGFEAKPLLLRRNHVQLTRHSATSPGTEINSLDLHDPATISSRVFTTDKRPVILFDGVCNMCNSAVNLALDWDPKGKLRFAALQSNVGRGLLQASGRNADDISSIVVVTSDGAYIKSDAVLRIAEELTPLSKLPLKPFAALTRAFVPKLLRDILYDGVANNRYSIMGKRDECRLNFDGEFDKRFVDDMIAVKVN